ncbi:MAG: hypothetical protein AB7U73_13730 [Pirellulales bacterium]
MNGTLPSWLEQTLGLEQAAAGEGTAWRLQASWPFAPWLTLLLALGAVAWVVALYQYDAGPGRRWRKALLVLLRLSALAVVLLMLAGLTLSLQRTGLPHLAVVLDDSASMGIADRYSDEELAARAAEQAQSAGFDEPTRLNVAKSLLLREDAALLRKLERDYNLRLYLLAGAARLQAGSAAEQQAALRELSPSGEATALGRGVRSVLADLRGTPPAALVLLTDGVTTEGEPLGDVAAYARRRGVPFYIVGLGDEKQVRDLELHDLLVDEVVFVDDIVQFEFTLSGAGYAGKRVPILLREKDKSEPVARLEVQVADDGQPQKVRLPYRPTEVGEFEYTIEIEPQEGESTTDNNREMRLVSVRREQIRVLLAQAYPNYEFRYLKTMLERDGTIEFHTVLQDSDPEYATSDKTALRLLPHRREELFAYDVIVLADMNPGYLSTSVLENVAAFVEEKGGGVIMVAGPEFNPSAFQGTPLARLVPMETRAADNGPWREGFQVLPTALGLDCPPFQLGDTPDETRRIWERLPPLYWFCEAAKLRPAARVLAEHPTRVMRDGRRVPLITLEYVGAGKVLFHAVDETWRWRYQVGDLYFARYWIQSIRYLSRSKLLGKDRSAELSVDRRSYRRGEPVRLRVRFVDERLAPPADDGVTVMVERDNQERRSVTLHRDSASQGVFEGLLPQSPEGRFHGWLVEPALEGRAPAVDFQVVAPPGEFERIEMDRAELERAADATRGRLYTLANLRDLAGALPSGQQVPIDTLPPIPLWNRWPVLIVLLVLLCGEWLLRKRMGLV